MTSCWRIQVVKICQVNAMPRFAISRSLISAKNCRLEIENKIITFKYGLFVIICCREDDKTILQLCQTRGLSENIYQDIAQELDNKTALQVKIHHFCFSLRYAAQALIPAFLENFKFCVIYRNVITKFIVFLRIRDCRFQHKILRFRQGNTRWKNACF